MVLRIKSYNFQGSDGLLSTFPVSWVCMMRFTNGEERKSMSVLVTFFFFSLKLQNLQKEPRSKFCAKSHFLKEYQDKNWMKESYMKKRISERRKCKEENFKLRRSQKFQFGQWWGDGSPPMYLALRVGKMIQPRKEWSLGSPVTEKLMGQVGWRPTCYHVDETVDDYLQTFQRHLSAEIAVVRNA